MAIDLLSLEPQKISRDLRGKYILLYGEPKCGKTTLASKFDNTLIVGFEQGTNALNNVYVQPTKTWSDWKKIVSQLCRNEELREKFHTICIDTSDIAWEACVKYICSNNGVEKLGDIPWGQGYEMSKKEYENSFRELTFAGYGLVFISHSTEKTYTDSNGEEYTKIVPALPNRPFDIVNKMVDIIAYIREIPEKNGEIIERKRYMFFRGNDKFLAGSRYAHMAAKTELSYENLVNAIYDAIDKASSGEATNEKNPYTIRSFDELMLEAKELWISISTKNKNQEALDILTEIFGKPTKFSEILPEQKDLLEKALLKIKEIN